MIKLENLTKKYDDRVVVDAVCCELPATGLVIIRGHNGSGKTTLLNLISSVLDADEGHVYFEDKDITAMSLDEKATYREENIDFIFQEGNLMEEMTVEDNIRIVGVSSQYEEVVRLLKLNDLLGKKAKELSGGEQARVALARALMKNSKIVVADEPTASIDSDFRMRIFALLENMSKSRLVLVVTHDEEALESYGDMVLSMDEGKLVNVEVRRNVENDNQIGPHKNAFNSWHFALANQFTNKWKIFRNAIMISVCLLLVLTTGVVATLDANKMHLDTVLAEGDEIFRIRSYVKDGEITLNAGEYTEEDIANISSRLEHRENSKVVEGYERDEVYLGFFTPFNENNSNFYDVSIGLNFKSIDVLEKVDKGRKPLWANEVVVSSFLAESIVANGVYTDKSLYKPSSVDELLNDGKEISLSWVDNSCKVVIVGIVNVDFSEYENLKDVKGYGLDVIQMKEVDRKRLAVSYSGNDIYVTSGFESTLDSSMFSDTNFYTVGGIERLDVRILEGEIGLESGETIDHLEKNEIVISLGMCKELGFLMDNYLGQMVGLDVKNSKMGEPEHIENLKVVGLSLDEKVYVSEELLSDRIHGFEKRAVAVYVKEENPAAVKRLFAEFPMYAGAYRLETLYQDDYRDLGTYIMLAVYVFAAIMLIFVILAVMFLLNYIKRSISYHGKEVAILKYLGIKDREIANIFAYETTVLGLTSYACTIALFAVLRIFVNAVFSANKGFEMNVLPFNLTVIVAVALGVSVLCYVVSRMAMSKYNQGKFRGSF